MRATSLVTERRDRQIDLIKPARNEFTGGSSSYCCSMTSYRISTSYQSVFALDCSGKTVRPLRARTEIAERRSPRPSKA